MSSPRSEGFWLERLRGVGLVTLLGLAVLAVATVIAVVALAMFG